MLGSADVLHAHSSAVWPFEWISDPLHFLHLRLGQHGAPVAAKRRRKRANSKTKKAEGSLQCYHWSALVLPSVLERLWSFAYSRRR